MINDLENNKFDKDVDIKSQIEEKKLAIDHKLVLKNTNDIKSNLKDINLHKKLFIKLYKNRTKNFDALSKSKYSFLPKSIVSEKETIDLTWKENIKSSVLNNHISIKEDIKVKIKVIIVKLLRNIDKLTNTYSKKLSVLAMFIIVFFWFILFSKFIIEFNVNSGYNKLIEIKNEDTTNMSDLVESSINNFSIANAFFSPFIIIPSEKINTPKHIIDWWKNIAYTIKDLLEVYKQLDSQIKKYWIKNIELTSLLHENEESIKKINTDLINTVNEYNKIKDLNEPTLTEKFETWKNYLNTLSKYLNSISNNFQTFLNILWDKKEKKYLVVFQNADEIRPTWWFMWSMGIVYMYKWRITKFVKEDVYSYEWNLKKADYMRLKAPEWINKLTPILWLRDSNFSINLQNSSENIKFFLNKAWYDIDWIVYINNTLIEDFLKLTWNISFTKIWENIKSSNFSEIMSLLVESKKFKNWTLGTPKQILFDFIEEFKEKLIVDWNYLAYLKIILDNIEKREIMIYSFSPKENNLLSDLDLNWKINYDSTIDFAYPVYTSISWNKSDRYLTRSYTKEVKKSKDCSIDTNFKISLTHNLDIENETKLKEMVKKYEIKTPQTMYIQWMWDNWQYIKLLIPKNAIIKENKAFKIEETPSAKAISFYIKTKRFETKSVTINYKLENKSCEDYSFNLYKQAWIRKYNLIFKNDEASIERKNISKDFNF